MPFERAAGFAQLLQGRSRDSDAGAEEYRDSGGNLVGFGFRPDTLPNGDSYLRWVFGGRPEGLEAYFEELSEDGRSQSSVYFDNVYTLPAYSVNGVGKEMLGGLMDEGVMEGVYGRGFKMLFAMAVARDFGGGEEGTVVVRREVGTRGFRVSALSAMGAQVGFLLVVVMVTGLCVLNARRGCELDGESNSIAAALQILAASGEMCEGLENAEFYSEEEVQRLLLARGKRYKLILEEGHGPRIEVNRGDGVKRVFEHRVEPWMGGRLWAMRTGTGIGLLAFFGLVAAVLTAVFCIARAQNGMNIASPGNDCH